MINLRVKFHYGCFQGEEVGQIAANVLVVMVTSIAEPLYLPLA